MFQGFSTRLTFPLTHSEFIKRAYNEIIDHTGRGRIFISLRWVLLCALLRFFSRQERREFFYFFERGFVIKCIYESSYYKLLFDVSSKKNHQELFFGSFDSPYTENTLKIVVASVK
jgi:hypothetical protein